MHQFCAAGARILPTGDDRGPGGEQNGVVIAQSKVEDCSGVGRSHLGIWLEMIWHVLPKSLQVRNELISASIKADVR